MLKFTPLEFETFCLSFPNSRQCLLKFTPLEFETSLSSCFFSLILVKIYSVGVWNNGYIGKTVLLNAALKFTPLEFETYSKPNSFIVKIWLKFTPLEFETAVYAKSRPSEPPLKFTPLEFETE